MNVQALASAGLLDRQMFLRRRPTADRARRMGRMHGVHEQHSLVRPQRIQHVLVGFDERLLLFRVELASDRLRLVVFERDAASPQPRTALISDAESSRYTRRRRASNAAGCSDPRLLRFLIFRQARAGAAAVKARQPLEPVLQEQLMPAPDGVVRRTAPRRQRCTAPAVVERDQRVRPPRQAMGRRPVLAQPDQIGPVFEGNANMRRDRHDPKCRYLHGRPALERAPAGGG